MIKYLKRVEILLAGIPLLFLVIEKIWFPGAIVDIHLHDTMFVIAGSHILWALLILMVFYLMMHLFLHQNRWRNKRLCNIHLAGTILCLLIICTFIIQPNPAPVDHSVTIADFKQSDRLNEWLVLTLTISLLIFILLQLLFLLYFMIEIIRKGITSKTAN